MGQNTMKAAALSEFGGPEKLQLQYLPVPDISDDEVLIKVEYAGVGSWDPFEIQGGYNEMLGLNSEFPYIPGSEGAGTIVQAGINVKDFKAGDKVYAPAFLNPKGGFYAEYTAVNYKLVSEIPGGLNIIEAAVFSGVGITALRGLEDVLQIKPGESLLILGASGGIGHSAVQLAKIMGAKVFAAASGKDGVDLVMKLGADAAADGHVKGLFQHLKDYAPSGFDAALFTGGGDTAGEAVQYLKPGGRIAYPAGSLVNIPGRNDIEIKDYYGDIDSDIIKRFNKLIEQGPYSVHVAKVFPLEEAVDALKYLTEHYTGKIAIKI